MSFNQIFTSLARQSEPDTKTAKLRRHDQPSKAAGAPERHAGVVKFFSRTRGYGFITPDAGGREVFVHYSAIEGEGYRNLYEGDQVEYDLVDRGKGPQAQNVTTQRRW